MSVPLARLVGENLRKGHESVKQTRKELPQGVPRITSGRASGTGLVSVPLARLVGENLRGSPLRCLVKPNPRRTRQPLERGAFASVKQTRKELPQGVPRILPGAKEGQTVCLLLLCVSGGENLRRVREANSKHLRLRSSPCRSQTNLLPPSTGSPITPHSPLLTAFDLAETPRSPRRRSRAASPPFSELSELSARAHAVATRCVCALYCLHRIRS